MILKLVVTEKYNQEIENKIINETMEMDNSFDITVELVNNIPLEPNGKKKYLKIIE